MTEITPIKLVEPVLYGVVKIEWSDGFAGIVDLRPVLAQGDIFAERRSDLAMYSSLHMATTSFGWTTKATG